MCHPTPVRPNRGVTLRLRTLTAVSPYALHLVTLRIGATWANPSNDTRASHRPGWYEFDRVARGTCARSDPGSAARALGA
jgi:hypothetical protein